MICTDIQPPFLLIFSNDIPQLLYFSHIPTALIALILGGFVYKNVRKKEKFSGLLLFLVSISFFIWSMLDVILWTNVNTDKISFVWSLINFIELFIASLTIYFSYVFLEKKDAPFKYKALFIGLLSVFVLFIPTKYNLSSFNFYICESKNGPLINYYYFLEAFSFLWLSIYLLRKNLSVNKNERRLTLLFSLGVIFFLFCFSGTNFFGDVNKQWEITQYGLFGMPVFMGFLAYLIIEYRIFNIKLLAAQALVLSIIILIGSQLFFIQNVTNRITTVVTLILVSLFGWWLVKSVEKEHKQKEELKLANIELKKLDQAKSDFINIASHQLRTPVTVIQGVASMLLDGDIDKMPKEEKQKFYESVWIKSKKLQTIINDILNATKIDNKVSEMDMIEDVDLCESLRKVVGDFAYEAKEREIDLVLDIPKTSIPIISGQKKYLEEVFVNLINNAIKYTPSSVMTSDVRRVRGNRSKAKVIVKIRKDDENIIIEIKDNGIGIPEKNANNLFKKFSRADNAVKMYTDGSGLGLYIVKEVIEDHGGRVWFESKVDKGTTFFVKLPIKTNKVSNIKKRILK
ncbi:MAG: ATP-binding protein [Candidatus Pacebacteria bacterium]|nr:ATP-binding protein [Candidatus Paceibacterota bacterium]